MHISVTGERTDLQPLPTSFAGRGRQARATKRANAPRTLRRLGVASVVFACVTAAGASGYPWLQTQLEVHPPAAEALDVYALFVDATPVSITVHAGRESAPWQATVHQLRTEVTLWRQMHLENWNTVPADLRADGLDAMLVKYRSVLMNPRVWDGMNVHDWDMVPQPVRTLAYRQMVAYWAGFYEVGDRYGLPSQARQRHLGCRGDGGVVVRASCRASRPIGKCRYRPCSSIGIRKRQTARTPSTRRRRCGSRGRGLLQSVERDALRRALDEATAR